MINVIEQLCNMNPVDDRPNEILKEASKHCTIDGDVLEFGVLSGFSINFLSSLFPNQKIYGFDSFEGLPEDWVVSENKTIYKKHFSLSGNLPQVNSNVSLIKGWFSDTLPTFKNNIFKIKLLHIDSDLYSSAIFVLNELNTNIVPGTIIVFDEFYPFPRPDAWYTLYQEGEYKALNEWCALHNRIVSPICRTKYEQCAFMVNQ